MWATWFSLSLTSAATVHSRTPTVEVFLWHVTKLEILVRTYYTSVRCMVPYVSTPES